MRPGSSRPNVPEKGGEVDLILNEFELRVLGALVEKKITTPDYYPLSLNALVNACNQKSSRDPVVAYDDQIVQRALVSLRDKKLAYVFSGSDARVPKYGHLFPEAFDLDEAETAVMCVLILRGPQTPGELRSRTASLHNFESLGDVEATILNLMSESRGRTLVARLPRQERTKESRYIHLLAGLPDMEAYAVAAPPVREAEPAQKSNLEHEIGELRKELDELKAQFAEFRKQFE